MLRKVTVAQMNYDMQCSLPFLFLIGSLILKGDSSFLQFVPSPLLLVCLWFSCIVPWYLNTCFDTKVMTSLIRGQQLHFLFIDVLKHCSLCENHTD